jgi:CheY-like chemotaxis protein
MTRILVVDDEPILRQVIELTLQKAGFDVVAAGNGKEGLDLYRKTSPDLVITDIMMPIMDGFETIRALKQITPGVKIIAMSGAGKAIDYLKMARGLGAAATITKPAERGELIATVQQVLQLDLQAKLP